MVDQLSSIDASFLHLETAETPMHTGSLMLIELPEGYQGDYYEDVKALFAQRLHLSPVLHRKLATMPFELAEPVWIEDDDVELDYHVRHATLRTGKFEELELLVARLHASLMDRSRPLWEIYVVDGLDSGQVGIYFKTHHAGVDGKGSVELAKVLYDDAATGRTVPAPRRRRGDRYQLGVGEMLAASATNALSQYRKIAESIPTAAKAVVAAAKVTNSQRTPRGQRDLILGLAPSTIFNDTITNQRSYTTMSTDLAELKALGKRVGGTVNTIVMATCSMALAGFLEERNLLPEKSLIAMVPVSLRAEGDNSANNQVSAVRVDLATDIADLPERFKAIHNSSEAAKAVVRELRPVLGVEVPTTGAPWFMTGMAQLIGRSKMVSKMPTAGNVLISNVPGMPNQMYFAGALISDMFPVSIPYHANALNITVVSYAGRLEWGITADRRILSQDESHELIQRMKDAISTIAELPSVAG